MRQITTDTRLPTADRNALVASGNLQCQANDCERQATRWSNLCGLCERQFLEDMKPVFGKPSREQLAAAQVIVRDYFAKEIRTSVFDDWASQIGRTFSRPLSVLPAPLAMKQHRYPRQRFAGCQSAFKFDPVSASNFDPFERRVLTVALASSELAGVAETWRARAA